METNYRIPSKDPYPQTGADDTSPSASQTPWPQAGRWQQADPPQQPIASQQADPPQQPVASQQADPPQQPVASQQAMLQAPSSPQQAVFQAPSSPHQPIAPLSPQQQHPGNNADPVLSFAAYLKQARKRFSRVGFFGLILMAGLLFGSLALMVAFIIALTALNPSGPQSEVVEYVTTGDGAYIVQLITYAIFVPLGCLVLRKVPRFRPEKCSMKPLMLIQLVAISFALSTLAQFIFDPIVDAAWALFGSETTTSSFMDENFGDVSLITLMFIIVIGPVIEELIFRRIIIDHTLQYGEAVAIFTSAIAFGLFHGNFAQMFYTFTFGLITAYVYVRTGKLRYSIGIHIFNNGLSEAATVGISLLEAGGIHASTMDDLTLVQSLLNLGDMPNGSLVVGAVLIIIVLVLQYGLIIGGVCSMWYVAHHLTIRTITTQLPRGVRLRTILGNPGAILYVAFCLMEATYIFLAYL